jgi:hypothetical protein
MSFERVTILWYTKGMYIRDSKKVYVCLLLFLIGIVFKTNKNIFAVPIKWGFQCSVFNIFEDNGLAADPMPILPMPGAICSTNLFPEVLNLSFVATLDMYGTYYGYSEVLDRAVPVALENRSAFVWGSILAIQVQYTFDLPEEMKIRLYGGPAIDARILLVASGLEGSDLEDASSQTKKVASYFWSQGRWFFPVCGIGYDFLTIGKMQIGTDIRCWFPVYKVWTEESLPFAEGWRLALGLRVSFR